MVDLLGCTWQGEKMMRKKSINMLCDVAQTVTDLEDKSRVARAGDGSEPLVNGLQEARRRLHHFLERHRDDAYRGKTQLGG